MADNVELDAGSGGAIAAGALLSFSGDSAVVQVISCGILSGSEGSWTYTLFAGGSGGVSAGVQRVCLATDVALPAGTNAIGKLAANTGVDIGDVDVTSVIPGTGATNLGKAIDTATGSTDTGVLLLGTRDDALSSLTPAEGDNVQLRVDANGALWVGISGTVTVASHAVTNAGTFAVQATQAGTWTVDLGATDNAVLDAIAASLALLDNAIATGNELQVDVVGALPAGTNNIGDVDVLSIIPGTGATNLGKAEDAAHASGDTGIMALGVRQSSQADFGADGDYVPFSVDDDGGLRVSIVAGAGSGGTAAADDADFTAGTTSGTPAMGVYESSPSSVTDGDLGTVGITQTRALRTSVEGTVTVGSHAVTNTGTFAVQAAQSGTWTVDLGATDNAVLDSIAALLGTIDTDTGNIVTATQLIDDAVYVDDADWTATTSKHFVIGGVYQSTPGSITDGDTGPFRVNANGALHVAIVSGAGSGGTASDDDADFTAGTTSGTPSMGVYESTPSSVTDGDMGIIGITQTRALRTAVEGTVTVASHAVTNAGTFAVQAAQSGTWNITNVSGTVSLPTGAATEAKQPALGTAGTASSNVITVQGIAAMTPILATLSGTNNIATVTAVTAITNALPAGTNAIGKLASNTGVTIGAVEIASAQTLATVTTVGTVTTCSTVTTVSTLTGGGIAHDSADSGNPHKIGAKAETSPKGITLVADGDRTDLYADSDGQLIVKSLTSGADFISEAVSNTDGNSTAFTNFGAVGSTKNAVTAYSIFRTDSGTTMAYVDFRDGTGGSVLWRVPLPPGGGANLSLGGLPIFKTSANTALAYDVSGALTTVYISVSGFQTKV